MLAAIALTLILSLGSILQPIQEYGVGPRQVVYLMGYFLPITLTFVLPMAALFAGALVYGRLAGDNELDACRASGISLPAMTYPGLALAIIVAIANLLLSFYVMPVFVHRAEKSFKADAKQILFRNIQRRRYYELPPDSRYLIYADQANMQNDTLLGAVVTEMKNNQIENIIMAEVAKVVFTAHETFSEVRITAVNSGQMGAGGEGGAQLGSLTKEVGSLLGDEINFKKIDDMRRIQANPMEFYPVAQLARETYAQLFIELLAEDIRSKTQDPRPKTQDPSLASGVWSLESGYELVGEPNSVKFTARQCRVQDAEVELSDEVLVMEYDTKSRSGSTAGLRTLRCVEATLHLEGDPLAPTLTMDLRNPQEAGSSQLRMRYVISGLIAPDAVEARAAEFKTKHGSLLPQKLASALPQITQFQPSPALTSLQGKLERQIRSTFVEIKAEIHSRLVFGMGCVPMIMIGIGLGIIKKGGHLLSAFGASCVPAAVLIVCIMSGKQLTQNLSAQTVSGVTLMWAGLGFLVLLTFGIYTWLLRR
jgi:lipopolysaccharide export LptBFGC system permease protein LptF